MIIVDGESIPPSTDQNDGDQGYDEALRAARLELKLCKALAALDPPHEVSAHLHARITELLRKLRRYDAIDHDVRQVADLADEEVREAVGTIRAIRALPSWMEKGLQGGNSFRAVLGGYPLDLVDEIEKRGRDKS